MRKKILLIYLCILVAGMVYAALIFFTDIQPKCISFELFGLPCGSCGVTRMLLSMVKLDFVAAFWYNPVLFVLFFVWNTIGVLCLTEKVELVKKPRFLYTVLGISVAAYVAICAVRVIQFIAAS